MSETITQSVKEPSVGKKLKKRKLPQAINAEMQSVNCMMPYQPIDYYTYMSNYGVGNYDVAYCGMSLQNYQIPPNCYMIPAVSQSELSKDWIANNNGNGTTKFLPVKKVKETATKLKSSLTADILSSSSVPKSILAMTFRQVILHHLWSYKLSIFSPGTKRDMEHLANPREIQIKFCISSSDELFLSKLSEVVCSWALENTKTSYLKNISGSSSNGIFDWLKKSLGSSTVDSSIHVCRLSQSEIANGAKKCFEKFHLAKGKSFCRKQHKHNLLDPPDFSPLEKVAGAGFGEWAKEFVPAYKLQVDGNLFKDIKLEGLQEMSNNRWEALLTHSQMDELVSILDMYYEDQYTLPGKELSCGLVIETSITTKKFMWKLFIGSIAGVCFLIITAVIAQIYWPNLLKTRRVSDQNNTLPLYEPNTHFKSLKTAEVKSLCVSVIQKIKDELGLPGDIMVDEKCGAWTGILPSYLKELISSDWEQIEDSSSVDSPVQDIASYQVRFLQDYTTAKPLYGVALFKNKLSILIKTSDPDFGQLGIEINFTL